MTIEELLNALVNNKASDLHLKVARPPLFRVAGRLIPSKSPPLNEEQVKSLVYGMMGPNRIRKFEEEQELDFSYAMKGLARFRVNVFQQRGYVGAVIRLIPFNIPTIDELKLPPVLKDIAAKSRGLILVTGPTGSGKSTTLASLIDYINSMKPCHILTIEDPIEFIYQDKMATINQRELGLDTKSLNEGLRHALRQDPDVILLGEMRDLETISTAVTAAETGHLVFSTLHTNDARQSIDRIIDIFPAEQQGQVRLQLSSSLLAVISQKLVRLANGPGRIAATEVMINSPTVQKLIAEGETSKLNQAIETSVTYYRMHTFNQSLFSLCRAGLITKEDALANSNNPEDLKLRLSGILAGKEEIEGGLGGGEAAPGFTRDEYLEV